MKFAQKIKRVLNKAFAKKRERVRSTDDLLLAMVMVVDKGDFSKKSHIFKDLEPIVNMTEKDDLVKSKFAMVEPMCPPDCVVDQARVSNDTTLELEISTSPTLRMEVQGRTEFTQWWCVLVHTIIECTIHILGSIFAVRVSLKTGIAYVFMHLRTLTYLGYIERHQPRMCVGSGHLP
jgi:hypothetical protein